MKITISGWPGSGSTTLSLILCKNLKLKYFSGGEVFRFLGKELNYENTGKDRIDVDIYLEKYIGPIVDKYIDQILVDPTFKNILIESDITNFRVGKRDDVDSIFLATNEEVRRARLNTDKRLNDIEVLKSRDLENQKFYNELYGVDWFSLEEIKQKHTLVIDNSQITIFEELNFVYNYLESVQHLEKNLAQELTKNSRLEEEFYFTNGKSHYIEFLKAGNLFHSSEMIVNDLNKLFSKEIEQFPEVLKNIFLRNK